MEDLLEMFDVLRKYEMKLNPLKCSFRVAYGKFLRFIVNFGDIEANPKQINVLKRVTAPRTRREMQSCTFAEGNSPKRTVETHS